MTSLPVLTRFRRLVVAVALVAAIGASLTGCSGGDGPTTLPITSKAATTPTASPSHVRTVDPPQATPSPGVSPEDASKAFGTAAADAGVREAYRVDAISAGMASLLAPGRHEAREFEPLREHLTPERWADLTRAVAKGDPEGVAASLTLSATPKGDVTIGTRTVRLAAPYVAGYTAGQHRTGVDRLQSGRTRLVVDVRSTHTLVTTSGPIDREVVRTYWLTPSGEDQWLVDGWETP